MSHSKHNAPAPAPAPDVVNAPAPAPAPDVVSAPAPAPDVVSAPAPIPTFEQELSGLTINSKQQTALTTLLAEVSKRDESHRVVSHPVLIDRKLVVLVNGARVSIGTGGGFEALDIRTYPKATVTFMSKADVYLDAQKTRDAATRARIEAEIADEAKANVEAAKVVAAAATIASK